MNEKININRRGRDWRVDAWSGELMHGRASRGGLWHGLERRGKEIKNNRRNKMTKKVKLSKIIEDMDLYPRPGIDSDHVRNIMMAMETGSKFQPIILTDKFVIVDGFHRKRALEKLSSKNTEIEAEIRTYKTNQDLFIDAMRLNAPHGLRISGEDRKYAIQKAIELKIDEQSIANALNITSIKIDKITNQFSQIHNMNIKIPVKNSVRHMAGKEITKEQAEVMPSLPGTTQNTQIKQLILMLNNDMINREDELTGQLMNQLHKAVKKWLEDIELEIAK